MDWDLAIKRNSEALKADHCGPFRHAGAGRRHHGGAASTLRPQRRAAGALAGRIRPAALDRHRGTRPCGEASARASGLASQACGTIRKSGGSRLSFQLFDPRKNFTMRQRRKYTRLEPRIHVLEDDSRGYPCGHRPGPSPPPALRPPMALSMPCPSPGGLRLSSWPSRICRARPGGWPAGGQGARPCQVRSSDHRSGLALHPAAAGSPFTSSMRCSSNAMASPGTR